MQAKKVIADLKAEVESLRKRNEDPEPDHQQRTSQQQPEIGRVNAHSLSSIHGRYERVLQVLQDNRCSMANAMDHREHDRVIRDHAGSVKELEAICRTRLGRYLPVLANLRREGKLLPLKFDERFYE